MRLSEAILLGDTLRRRDAWVFLQLLSDGTYCGCAIGGALLAVGDTREASSESFEIEPYIQCWPWLAEMCPEGNSWVSKVGCNWAHGFAAVCAGRLTIEQLADWVRSVEPACGVCCRFGCSGCAEPAIAPLTQGVALQAEVAL